MGLALRNPLRNSSRVKLLILGTSQLETKILTLFWLHSRIRKLTPFTHQATQKLVWSSKQARQIGLNVPIVGSDGMADAKLVQIAGAKNASNIYYTTPFSKTVAEKNPTAVKFMNAYKARYHTDAQLSQHWHTIQHTWSNKLLKVKNQLTPLRLLRVLQTSKTSTVLQVKSLSMAWCQQANRRWTSEQW